MSDLAFDGAAHTLSLKDRDGKVIGFWTAYNRVDTSRHFRFLPNGTYLLKDTKSPHHHPSAKGKGGILMDSPDGEYGSYGTIRLALSGGQTDWGNIAIHSGRAHALNGSGPLHATDGCIRTNDAAMKTIVETMATDRLTLLVVRNNYDQARTAEDPKTTPAQ